jgi:HK97 family phage major capsid protein
MSWYTLKKEFAGHAPGETIQMEAKSAEALVAAGFLEAAADKPENDLLAKAMDTLSEKLGPAIEKAVGAAVDSATQAVAARTGSISLVAAQEDKTKSFGDFFAAVLTGDREKLVNVYGSTKTGPLQSTSGPAGGYLVPPEFMAQILQVSAEEGVVRPRAMVIPISNRSIQIPALDQTSIPIAGQTAFFGGLQAYWVEEAQARPEVEPSFKQIELTARELSGYSTVSRTLLADNAFGLNQILTRMFAKAIAWHEDYAFMHGNGVGKPRGVSQSSAAITVNRTTPTTFKLADAANMWAKLLPASATNAVWVMSQTLIPQLIQLADASGRVVFMPNPAATSSSGGPLTQSMPMSLLGRPIIFTEKAPPLGTTADVMLVDLSYYLVGDRQSIEVATSEHARFATNQIVWRFIHRVDGQPWLDAPFTYSDGTTQVSPFIILN